MTFKPGDRVRITNGWGQYDTEATVIERIADTDYITGDGYPLEYDTALMLDIPRFPGDGGFFWLTDKLVLAKSADDDTFRELRQAADSLRSKGWVVNIELTAPVQTYKV